MWLEGGGDITWRPECGESGDRVSAPGAGRPEVTLSDAEEQVQGGGRRCLTSGSSRRAPQRGSPGPWSCFHKAGVMIPAEERDHRSRPPTAPRDPCVPGSRALPVLMSSVFAGGSLCASGDSARF